MKGIVDDFYAKRERGLVRRERRAFPAQQLDSESTSEKARYGSFGFRELFETQGVELLNAATTRQAEARSAWTDVASWPFHIGLRGRSPLFDEFSNHPVAHAQTTYPQQEGQGKRRYFAVYA